MTRTLTAFNHYGVGDLWESREFVLEWMRVLGISECEYACRYPAVFEDLPQIRTRPLTDDLNMRHWASRRNGRYMLNTWIGALNGETNPKGDYVIWPGIGCCVENILRMNNDYLKRLGLPRITKPAQDFLTTVDYGRINKGNVDNFVLSDNIMGRHKIVLVCNGPTGSGHAANFDMARMVELLPESDSVFVFTERATCNKPLVFFTDDITERNGRCDVLAISYLSRFCNVIVGRCSGAQMVCETKENWMNPNKTLVSFTQHRNGACFPFNPEALGLKMRLVHSTATTPEEAAEVLRNVLTPPASVDGKSAYLKQEPGNTVLD